MKKRNLILLCTIALTIAICFTMTACDLFGGDDEDENIDEPNNTPSEYTIQYTDDSGTHTITVKGGDLYALEVIPQRDGYEFLGLFDAQVGGTQYVASNGSALSPFTDKKNIVLFPQFAPKQYTVVLDYGDAAVTGEREFAVNYGEKLPELPKNLSLDHSTFSGWYTEPNAGGTKVADAYGLLPVVSVVNSDNFDLSSEYITLYAGFDAQKFTVTFNFGNGMQPEEVDAAYGTPISEVVPNTRNEQGYAVLSWSKTQNGEQIFNGKVTDNLVLYAAEWAPIIDLDLNGGEGSTAVIAHANTTISLPTPTRTNYKFMHWETTNGDIADFTTMPTSSTQLKAVWQAMLIFDENGGTEVKDISQATGTSITLPTPEKEGFIFAGWYTADETEYDSTSMPATSVELKAGWYTVQSKQKVFLASNAESSTIYTKAPAFYTSYVINFTEECSEVDWSKGITVNLKFHADIKHNREDDSPTALYATKEHFGYYSQNIVSETYLIDKTILNHGNNEINTTYTPQDWSVTLDVPTKGIIYLGLSADKDSDTSWGDATGWKMSNFYVTIEYPDTSNLYL